MVFRPSSAPRPYRSLSVKVDEHLIHEIDMYKVLGTFLTADLNFDHHFSVVTKRAYAAFHQARSFIINNKQPVQEAMMILFKSVIRHRIDFSVAATVNISQKSLNLLVSLQRTCLIAATKCIPQTPVKNSM